MAHVSNENSTPVTFLADDGYELCGTYVSCPVPATQAPVLICPATGVKQTFYLSFATWLGENGHPVLVFDYRGIGTSLARNDLKACKARKQDWGEKDMPAALNWLLKQTGQKQAILIGNSAGAQLVGLMPNHKAISHLIAVSASSGYVGNVRFSMRIFAFFFVWIYIPLAVWLLGYLPAKRIGWGENLPAGVARQWARWCRHPGYVENDFNKSIKKNYFKELTFPVSLVYAEDDPLATRKNVDDWLRLLPAAPKDIVLLHPKEVGGQKIGHIDMFRESRSAIWQRLLALTDQSKEMS